MLCDDLEGWDGGGGREAQEEGDICIHIAVSHCVQQKLTQHCKAITLQLKKKLRIKVAEKHYILYEGEKSLYI